MADKEHVSPRRFNRSSIQRFLLKWHAHIGLIAAIFILILTITGLALNHQDTLGIHNNEVTSDWVLDWYYGDVEASSRPQSIPMSRVVLDIHTGHFFGITGATLMDITSLLLLFLVGSGIYNWVKRKRW